MTGPFPPPFLLIRNKLPKNPTFERKTFEMEPFSSIAFTSDLLFFVVPDLNLVPLEPSPVLVPLEEEFGNLVLKPRVLDLLSIVSKLGEICLSSRLGHILDFFAWKISFLELDKHELIPHNLP